MFLPYRIDTLFKHWPVANWVIMAATVVMYFASRTFDETTLDDLILGGTSPLGLLGHMLLHGGLLHLAGNLLFLWVFGNAVCAMMSNVVYLILYVTFGVLAAAAHLAWSGDPAIGASGAINGVVGMAFVMYPRNAVSVFWFIVFRGGAFEMPLWVLAALWFAFDAYGAFTGGGDVAYWAHLGGFAAGAAAAALGLRFGWLTLTQHDNAALVQQRTSKPPIAARERSWENELYPRD